MKKDPIENLRKKQTQRLPSAESKMRLAPVFDDVAKKYSHNQKKDF